MEEKVKIKRFINDLGTAKAVYNRLLKNFKKKREGSDVYLLASQKLSIEALDETWAEMEREVVNLDADDKPKITHV